MPLSSRPPSLSTTSFSSRTTTIFYNTSFPPPPTKSRATPFRGSAMEMSPGHATPWTRGGRFDSVLHLFSFCVPSLPFLPPPLLYSPCLQGVPGVSIPTPGAPPLCGAPTMWFREGGGIFTILFLALFRASDHGLRARDHMGCETRAPRIEQFQYKPNPL